MAGGGDGDGDLLNYSDCAGEDQEPSTDAAPDAAYENEYEFESGCEASQRCHFGACCLTSTSCRGAVGFSAQNAND